MGKGPSAFVDNAVIEVESGTGGSGSDAFRREKGVPRGGPAGGDGGRGGDVVLVGDPSLSSLLDYRYRRHYRAGRGGHGEGRNRTGRDGADRTLRVPLGTAVFDDDSGRLLGELTEAGQEVVVAKGGRGGRGNVRFVTASRQAPRRWEPGGEGAKLTLCLQLSLMADAGLVGEPNAGKSTFLSATTKARPKVADYAFTTLTPHLGVSELPGFRSLVMADLPGLIEGAHVNRGLGHRFLRHVERTRALAFVIPVDVEDPQQSLDGLRRELEAYSPALLSVPWVVLMTKTDLLAPGMPLPEVRAQGAAAVLGVSSVARRGLAEAVEALWTASRA